MPNLTPDQIESLKNLPPLMRRRYAIFYQLPKEIQERIVSVRTAEKNGEIAEKHKLSESATEQMSYIIGMVLLGETNIVNFVKSLMKECNLNEQSARQLARDINSSIFLPVKESLKKIHKVPEWPREEEPGRPISQPGIPQKNHEVVALEEKKSEIPSNIVNLKEE